MNMYYDGVQIHVLPDYAKCKLAGENPLYISKCPLGRDACDPDCLQYTEDDSICDNDCEHCNWATCPKEDI